MVMWVIRSSPVAIVRPERCSPGPCHQVPRSPRFEVFKMRGLRIDQQAGRHGEGRALGLFRKAGDAERAADADRAAEDARGKLGEAGELACAAGENNAGARLSGERRSRQAVARPFRGSPRRAA